MKKINVKNSQNIITNSAKFSSDELCISWYNQQNSNGSFLQNNTYEIVDMTAELLSQQESQDALKYLTSTDWYVVRKAETGIDYPQEVKDLRAAARLKVL
jgi:hypothetical protein